MPHDLDLVRAPGLVPGAGRLACLLGSFDPVHRGHIFMMEKLLARSGALLVLVPARHFDKSVVAGLNASLAQRLCMIDQHFAGRRAQVGLGLAHEVLFVRLARALARRFPGVELCFGMGDETHARLLDSRRYCERWGLPWTPEDARTLAALCQRAVVFGRSRAAPGLVDVPPQLRRISSTLVRATAARLWREGAGADAWQRALAPLLPAGVCSFVRRAGLYREATDVTLVTPT